MTSGASVLSRKRDVVRSDLARIAIELFARHGFEAVTVDEIAKTAGISSRTFFRYFASKDDIVLDLASHLQDRLLAVFEARPAAEGAVEALRHAFALTARITPEDREQGPPGGAHPGLFPGPEAGVIRPSLGGRSASSRPGGRPDGRRTG